VRQSMQVAMAQLARPQAASTMATVLQRISQR
jgi:hypothetical protein